MHPTLRFAATCAALFCALPANALSLLSPAFSNNGIIPNQFTYSLGSQCSGGNQSPPLAISGIPAGTQSLALTVIDPDGGDWVHWLAWNIPASTATLLQDASATATFNQGINDFGTKGYGGPCPPTPNHRYVFTLYALDSTFPNQPSVAQLQRASLATTTLIGLRSSTDSVVFSASSNSDCIFAWAERTFPQFFSPAGAVSGTVAPYYYRYYADTTTYLAASSADNHLWVYGPASGNVPLDVGPITSFQSLAGCSP